jgi:hypothetical protein
MYLADLGCGWSFPQESEQALKSRASSLSQYFHTAITMVAGISTQAKREGLIHDKVAEADSLHPPIHKGMEFLNVISVVLACHELHHSILSLISPVVPEVMIPYRKIFRKLSVITCML